MGEFGPDPIGQGAAQLERAFPGFVSDEDAILSQGPQTERHEREHGEHDEQALPEEGRWVFWAEPRVHAGLSVTDSTGISMEKRRLELSWI
jgi:hypothetical protein